MPEPSFVELMSTSHLSGGSLAYIEAMYEQYLEDQTALPKEWKTYFDALPKPTDGTSEFSHSPVIGHFERLGRNRLKAVPERVATDVTTEHERKQVRVLELIDSYRSRGHRRAMLDPLGVWTREDVPDLNLEYHGLSQADLSTVFDTGFDSTFEGNKASLEEILSALRETYCGSIGTEHNYITDKSEQLWIRNRLEKVRSSPQFDPSMKRAILDRLTAAEGLEKYLHNMYPGTKRFGLEGGESLIPMIHELLQQCGKWYIKEVVIGLAHRGRLNILVNVLGKNPRELFDEFEGVVPDDDYLGDVKYHQGFSSDMETPGGHMHVALAFNPSHLEIVNPVVEGSVRARQDRRGDASGQQVIPILIHGDAAIAGQGVVMETFQMSQTRAYTTGGSIHIIINNQIGFTTHRREDARSTEYCSEIAKMVRAPIFHVNADDPEALVFVAQIAVEYRMAFGKDVVIDMVCYRRRGHNEAEDPMKTQPIMYRQIQQHPTTREIYAKQLIAEGVTNASEINGMANAVRDRLDRGENIALDIITEPDSGSFVDWQPFIGHHWKTPAKTRFDAQELIALTERAHHVPDKFVVHSQVRKIFDDRKRMSRGALPANWGFGETMAYATLLSEGHSVRLVGQDVGVGTFSHRHACLYCQSTGDQFVPLAHATDQARFSVYDSLLSEEAALAFEYGYATTTPNGLVIWEAQFGDFANGAQVVIDQFVSSGEAKWQRMCGLVMLLPHGYEGAGPEHSSARLERYLQLCAQENIQVCLPTTPSQMFHMLRRQAIRPLRKPLVAFTPKSLLRDKRAVSQLEDFTEQKFHPVLDDASVEDPASVSRMVLCSGKVYYDLMKRKEEAGVEHIALVRIEQLYPFPREALSRVLRRYTELGHVVWCQEEPQNQGAWYQSKHHFQQCLRDDVGTAKQIAYAGRPNFAAPASGYMKMFLRAQKELVEAALFG